MIDTSSMIDTVSTSCLLYSLLGFSCFLVGFLMWAYRVSPVDLLLKWIKRATAGEISTMTNDINIDEDGNGPYRNS